jgi:hypothetical protein
MIGKPGSDVDRLEDPVGGSDVKLTVGAKACVWNYYLGRWTGGFAVAEVVPGGYRLRRLSDGHVFSDVFSTNEVMEERRKVQELTYGLHLDRRTPRTGE